MCSFALDLFSGENADSIFLGKYFPNYTQGILNRMDRAKWVEFSLNVLKVLFL